MGNMANGDGRVNWGIVKDIAQVLIYPILLGLVYLGVQNSTLDRRLAVIESKPSVDFALIQKIAIMEDRQNMVMREQAEHGKLLVENGNMLRDLSATINRHDSRTWIDPDLRRRR
jgi:hypothetical protein